MRRPLSLCQVGAGVGRALSLPRSSSLIGPRRRSSASSISAGCSRARQLYDPDSTSPSRTASVAPRLACTGQGQRHHLPERLELRRAPRQFRQRSRRHLGAGPWEFLITHSLAIDQPAVAIDDDQPALANCDAVEVAGADQFIDAGAAQPRQDTEFGNGRGDNTILKGSPFASLPWDDGEQNARLRAAGLST